jgi:HPr kinase/phosphorylase
LKPLDQAALERIDRLAGSLSATTILGVAVPRITMPVAPGRNLAIIVEAAVRHQILRIRGYDAGVDFIDRQARAIGNDRPDPPRMHPDAAAPGPVGGPAHGRPDPPD